MKILLGEAPDSKQDSKEPIVRYRNVSKSFGDVHVLKEMDLDIAPGEKIAVIGPSGSGKTTLARLLMTLEAPTSGTIEVNGELLWHQIHAGKTMPADEKHLRKIRKNIGFVFQHFNLFPHMNILRNVSAGPIHVLGLSKDEAIARSQEMLRKVGLIDKIDAYPSQLSGGQKQRVAIARAVVMNPKIMLFDEVTSALDPELVGEVLTVIRELAAQKEMAMLLITHEMDFAREIADRIIFIDQGRIIEQGTPQQIFENPQSERLQAFLNRFLNKEPDGVTP
ncbi:ectoine/hydroxyectoine ABC transporter ATP-binding protein EhuA [Paenibacillus agricola]|uniref:Ectoine/hydroxyectoine ABC transporter ATP-binding protein EhuA n=1 Tax=Paenibacillus agricola TaxID=2716264 RepID=A0ABX0JAS6_9BACL|nr:ectoine/hydroxyectoine ABC transporter ATP-binding protein EhuA [Paenibacillus agricola]NHN33242.1 ectoine/hydroxyectoine ABC transporter ATP-binding protein EhuA [Paenibacillus agricola]